MPYEKTFSAPFLIVPITFVIIGLCLLGYSLTRSTLTPQQLAALQLIGELKQQPEPKLTEQERLKIERTKIYSAYFKLSTSNIEESKQAVARAAFDSMFNEFHRREAQDPVAFIEWAKPIVKVATVDSIIAAYQQGSRVDASTERDDFQLVVFDIVHLRSIRITTDCSRGRLSAGKQSLPDGRPG